MPFSDAAALGADVALPLQLSPEREAKEPAELRGAGRDDVRLLVTLGDSLHHAHFRQLPDFLAPDDLLVVNTSATIPAAIQAQRADGAPLPLHVSTRLPADLVIVEPRAAGVEAAERLQLPGEGSAALLTPYRNSRRLWVSRLRLPMGFLEYLNAYGQPIRYRHSAGVWPLESYQNVYAKEPGSAEMPSAGRPITHDMLERLHRMGIGVAFIVLHAGVSSLETGEAPHEEFFEVPSLTAAAIRRTRRRGGRVIAVGTTVVRALESALDQSGSVVAARGWTELVIDPEHRVHAVDGLLTGFHEPNSSHLAMLASFCGRRGLLAAYRAALKRGYLWHEFGDSHLLLTREATRAAA